MRQTSTLLVLAWLLLGFGLAGCRQDSAEALGTLEYERISLPAPASERIVAIEVREGAEVRSGQPLLRLERTRLAASTEALRADVQRQQSVLAELEAGPREEAIRRARAELASATAMLREAKANWKRVEEMAARKLVAASEVDRARMGADSATAQVRAAQAALDELNHGTRAEQLAQGEAAVHAAQAQLAAQQDLLDRLDVTAPRDGRVDSLPYELGDQAPVGAPLAILLVGDRPYARVYVPAPIRRRIAVGTSAQVRVGTDAKAIAGRVRVIRNEPVFTPYYALSGEDAARLSYLAEIELTGADSVGLPAGLPVSVDFDAASADAKPAP